MKKLLGIVVLGLLWSGNAYAEVFALKQCYYKGEDTQWKASEWKKDSEESKAYIDQTSGELKFSKEKFLYKEDHIISIDTNKQKIFITYKYTDFYIEQGKFWVNFYETELGKKRKKKILGENPNDPNGFWKVYMRDYKNRQNFELSEFSLITYAEGIVIGQSTSQNTILDKKIFIDLNKNTYIIGYKQNENNLPQLGGYICNSQDTDSGIESVASSGTAFFISNKGYLLTNNHVVEGCKAQKINYFNKEYDAQIIATDKNLDLALLKVDTKNKNYINFSKSEIEKLQKVYVAGYPFGKGLSDDLKVSSGIISSNKGFEDNSNEFQIDAPINPGNSGGPIVNDTGELVGIAVAGFAKDKSEGINFGIKSSSAITFLKTNKIKPGNSYMTFAMNNKKLLKLLEESTVYTFCN